MLKKKFTLLFLMIFIAVSSFFPIQIYAQLGGVVTDPGNTSVNITRNVWDVALEQVLRPTGIAVADKLLGKLSSDLVSWANNGFDGEPGFINNYGELLKGIETDVIGAAFNTATGIANTVQQNNNIAGQEQFNQCETNAYAEWEEDLNFVTEPQANFFLETALVECRIEISTNSSVNEYTQCFANNEQAGQNHATGMMTGVSPEFVNEFPDYLNQSPDDQLEWNDDGFRYYEFMYKRNQCYNNLQEGNFTGDLGQVAQQNWNLFQSGEVNSSRAVAGTIASFGTQQLNDDRFNQLVSGGGDLTLALLGSQGRKDDFKTDITAGGWDGILSLTGEGSTDLALTTTAKVLVGNEVEQKKAIEEAALALPTAILPKKVCVAYVRNPSTGERTEECAREIIGTPGDIVGASLEEALKKDQATLETFGDDIVLLLLQTVGSTVSKLTDRGLGQLTTAASNAFFSPGDTEIFTQATPNGTNFQSQYDVLGIETNTNTSFAGVEVVGNTGPSGSIDTSFIGGPENADNNGPLGSGPQVIIDLQENLEININYAEQELKYFEQSEDIVENTKQTAIKLDRCLPGPDYNWEERYEDTFDTFGDGDSSVLNRIGLIETREMVNDPLVNIPGSIKIRDTFSGIVGSSRTESAQLRERKNQLETVLRSLEYMEDEITTQFNVIQSDLGLNNMILFKKQWDPFIWYSEKNAGDISLSERANIIAQSMSENEKITALENAALGFTKSDGTDSGAYILIKNDEGETAESIVQNESDRARDAVIAMAWDMWRDRTDTQTKTDLRYSYYVLQNNLSNEQFIARARANYTRIDNSSVEAEKLLSDCLVLKSYTFGTSISDLLSTTLGNSNSQSATESAAVNTALFALNPYLAFANIGNFLISSTGNFNFIEPLTTPRTNEQVKRFLQDQYILYSDGNPNTQSLFSTSFMISPNAINSSILGFDDTQNETVLVQTSTGGNTGNADFEEQTLPESEAYFQSNYPDFNFKPIQKNRTEIFDLWKYDRFSSSFSRARGLRSILYCRNSRISDLQKSGGLGGDDDSDFQPECIRRDWPIASNLDYELLFEEI